MGYYYGRPGHVLFGRIVVAFKLSASAGSSEVLFYKNFEDKNIEGDADERGLAHKVSEESFRVPQRLLMPSKF